MGAIDVEALLKEISPEQPCGENLEYDPAFQELEALVQGRPQTQSGEAEEPDWRDIASRCVELLARTKDLRPSLYLSLAALRMEGVRGLRDGLALMCGLLEKYWDKVHPQPDPDDPQDYLARMNVIVSVAVTSFGDPYKFLPRLREAPLCNSRRAGKFCYRDIQVAKGEISLPEGSESKPPELAAVSAAFQDTETEELKATGDALQDLLKCVDKIDHILTERAGADQAPDLTGLKKTLEEISGQFRELSPAGLAGEGQVEQPQAAGEAQGEDVLGAGAKRISGEIASRQDVIVALDKICKYYKKCEPGSPVPFLLEWAKRLVDKDFLKVIEELSPEAVAQFRAIVGAKVDSQGEQK
jgi:type VI secretion system protein ImpA